MNTPAKLWVDVSEFPVHIWIRRNIGDGDGRISTVICVHGDILSRIKLSSWTVLVYRKKFCGEHQFLNNPPSPRMEPRSEMKLRKYSDSINTNSLLPSWKSSMYSRTVRSMVLFWFCRSWIWTSLEPRDWFMSRILLFLTSDVNRYPNPGIER